jgi:two-component system nitrate/nitrite response regulator NarL
VNVVICDDHRLFTDALATVLAARAWTIVSCAVDPAHAVAAIAQTRVDACLMDLSFPEGNIGLEGIVSVHEASPDTKVVVLTASSDPQLIIRAVQSGADAIVFKDDELDHIVNVVERTQHDAVTRPSVAPPRVADPEPTPPSATATGREIDQLGRFLTKREHEVLEHIVRGESGRYLADQMNISYSTARTHIQNILAKLGVHSRLEALAFAVEHDLCRPASNTGVQTKLKELGI